MKKKQSNIIKLKTKKSEEKQQKTLFLGEKI